MVFFFFSQNVVKKEYLRAKICADTDGTDRVERLKMEDINFQISKN
jgi:hypothetical protein